MSSPVSETAAAKTALVANGSVQNGQVAEWLVTKQEEIFLLIRY